MCIYDQSTMSGETTTTTTTTSSKEDSAAWNGGSGSGSGDSSTTSTSCRRRPPAAGTCGESRSASGATCGGCARPIADRFLLYAMERHWHVGCLRCSVCQTPLDDVVATCYTRAGLILCRADYLRSVSSRHTG